MHQAFPRPERLLSPFSYSLSEDVWRKGGRERGEVEYTYFSARIPTVPDGEFCTEGKFAVEPIRTLKRPPKGAHGLREYFITKNAEM